MAERAQVTSLEAIESFRASLIVFVARARAALEEADDEKQRTKSWLQNEQRTRWENECRRLKRGLDEAQQELFSAKLSRLRTESAAQLLAVERAKRALQAAEEKRDLIKRWTREFDNRVDPLAKQLDQLHTFLTTDLAKAAAYLGNVQRALEAYTAIGLGATDAGPANPAPPLASQVGHLAGNGDPDLASRTGPDPREDPPS